MKAPCGKFKSTPLTYSKHIWKCRCCQQINKLKHKLEFVKHENERLQRELLILSDQLTVKSVCVENTSTLQQIKRTRA